MVTEALTPINNTDRELDEAIAVLQQAKRERASMYLSEFNRYVPIFRYEGEHQLGPERYQQLCMEWMNRVDIFEPLHVINDETREVVFTLPPMFNRIASVNRVKNGHDIASAFQKACDLQDEFDNKKSIWGGYLKRVWEQANPTAELDQARTKSDQMVDRLKKQGVIKEPDQEVISNTTTDTPSHTGTTHVTMADMGDVDVEPL